jgi:hypothetical protein
MEGFDQEGRRSVDRATLYTVTIVWAHTPAFGLKDVRVVIIGIRLQTQTRVIVGIDV